MARGTQFLQLVTMLRAELRRSLNPSVGVEDVPELQRLIVRQYEKLVLDHDWPHLCKLFTPIMLNAGQRYYDMPAGLDYERVKDVALYYSAIPSYLERGITFQEYAFSNPDLGSRSDPALKWDVRYGDGVQELIEIWPVPAGTGVSKVQFFGYITVPRLVNDQDLCLLDDNLVVLFAAAEALTGQKSADAQIKAAEAMALLGKLRGRSQNHSRVVAIGQGENVRTVSPRAIVRIRG